MNVVAVVIGLIATVIIVLLSVACLYFWYKYAKVISDQDNDAITQLYKNGSVTDKYNYNECNAKIKTTTRAIDEYLQNIGKNGDKAFKNHLKALKEILGEDATED